MRNIRGFTLIELLVVLAIIGILAGFAIPSYNEYVMRSRITEAVGTLSDMRVKMEQVFQDTRDYTNGCGASGTLAALPAATTNFTFRCTTACDTTVTSLTTTTYTVRACGQGPMAGFEYIIDQANTRTTVSVGSDWSGGGSTCWVLRKNGAC